MKNIFCFLNGFIFAFMQFGFLLMLQINVTSTYVTYALVTICWMAGALAGLWIKSLNPFWLMAIQPVAFYLAYLLATYAPFASFTFPLAASLVAAAGLWAGRFFPEMLKAGKRTDSLFFHENNGFIVGVLCFFVGFTMLGRPFLLAVPMIFVIVLLPLYKKAGIALAGTN